MRIQIVAQYFWPEPVGAGVWLRQLAGDLAARGHEVTVVTAMPNYPEGRVHERYRRRVLARERVDGIEVVRTWIYATPRKDFWPRAASFASFCATSMPGQMLGCRPDVVYCVLPPLPLGWAVEFIAGLRRVPVVVNLQDIYPEIAVRLGYLHSRAAIRFFESLEKAIYRRAARIVVITDSFRENLRGKGVPAKKMRVIPNWADAQEIRPAPRQNAFRERAGLNGQFAVVYSGSLGHNSQLDGLLGAAALLHAEPFRFLLIGEGARRAELEQRARQRSLHNLSFLPFQPAEVYPQVLAASDVQVVSLAAAATDMSLPSKALKVLASGRPLLALARAESDLAKLVRAAKCGVAVEPEDATGLATAVRWLAAHPRDLEAMATNARSYFLEHFERTRCIGAIEAVLKEATGQK
jgi:colanic acid biosynthesis glycosyl transferase WcaI